MAVENFSEFRRYVLERFQDPGVEVVRHGPAVPLGDDLGSFLVGEGLSIGPLAPERIILVSEHKVLLVHDHAVVRQGLRTFLELQDDMQVAGEAANGVEATEQAKKCQPDIVLLDLLMPKMGGVEATPHIIAACPQARVIILTSFGEDDQVIPAIRAGAQRYLLKDIPPHDLVQALREAHQGKAQLHPDVARKLMSAVAARRPQPLHPNPI